MVNLMPIKKTHTKIYASLKEAMHKLFCLCLTTEAAQ